MTHLNLGYPKRDLISEADDSTVMTPFPVRATLQGTTKTHMVIHPRWNVVCLALCQSKAGEVLSQGLMSGL